MTRPLTPVERHDRTLDRGLPGSGYDPYAPVRRQGPKGNVVPPGPSDDLPQPVEESAGAAGDSGDTSDAAHKHPFVLSDAVPAQVDPGGAGSAGVGAGVTRDTHQHGVPISGLTPVPITDAPGSAGATGELSDAGHAHHFDPVAAGIPPWSVNADPDTLSLRGPAGTLSVAPSSAPEHAIANSEVSVAPAANAISRRNASSQLETAPATAGTHAIALSQATVPATANAIARRDANGNTNVGTATAGGHAVSRDTGDGRYAAIAHVSDTAPHSATVAATPDRLALRDSDGGGTFTTVFVPNGSALTPSVRIGEGGTGWYLAATDHMAATLTGDPVLSIRGGVAPAVYPEPSSGVVGLGLSNRQWADLRVAGGSAANPAVNVNGDGLWQPSAGTLNVATGGVNRTQVGSAGLRPATSGLPLGLTAQRWGNFRGDGIIETTGTNATGPVIHAPNGVIEGADFVTPGSLYADDAAFGLRSAQHVAVSGGTGSGQGIVAGVKTGGNLRVQVEAGLSYRPVAASSFDINSDARRKVLTDGGQRDHLADVLATPTDLFRRREQAPIRPDGADERTPPTEIREALGEEQLGWLANNLTPDVAVLMGNEIEGWEVGYAVEQQLAKLWEAFRQSHADHDARLTALEPA